jgi:hypothetical protein
MFRWRDGFVGAALGGVIAALRWAEWQASFPLPMTIAYGGGTGLVLGLTHGTPVTDWIGDLFASRW